MRWYNILMSDLLKLLHKRVVWRCCQWAPILGSVWVLALIQAGVWGGPYAFRLSTHVDDRAHPSTPIDQSSTRSNASRAVDGELSLESISYAHDVYSTTSSVLQSEFVSLMSDLNLGDLDINTSIMSSIVPRMPETIGELAGEDRKKAFIGLMIPTVMVALDEVRQERQLLMAIISELGGDATGLYFAEDQLEWQYRIGTDKSRFIIALTKKYRTTSAQELADMINVLPPSLILAQGALESGWGGSRIALNSNNLFGMYSAMVSNTPERTTVLRVMEYDTILDSVRAYILNLNRLSAYKKLREIRLQTLDPLQIADGLSKYSERKGLYIADVKLIIELNQLQHYDALLLAAG